MNKALVSLIIIIISIGLLYLLGPVLTPFLVGALLAYLVDPLVNQLMRWKLPRLVAVSLVFFVLFLIILLLILLCVPLIENQLATLIEMLPQLAVWLQSTVVDWLNKHLGMQELIDINLVKSTLTSSLTKATSIAGWLFKTIVHSGMTLAIWLTNLVLIPVVTFYLLRDWNKVVNGLRNLLPRSMEPTVVSLVIECDAVLSAFFRGQLLVMLALGIIYSIGLTLVGIKVGLMIGLVAGLVSIVPYLGFIVGIITASIVAFVQFGSFSSVLLVWLVFAIGQSIESSVLTPNLVGDRIGLHPVAVIFAVLTGGTLFGFFGVLLALPAAAVIMVLIRFMYLHYQNSQLYQ